MGKYAIFDGDRRTKYAHQRMDCYHNLERESAEAVLKKLPEKTFIVRPHSDKKESTTCVVISYKEKEKIFHKPVMIIGLGAYLDEHYDSFSTVPNKMISFNDSYMKRAAIGFFKNVGLPPNVALIIKNFLNENDVKKLILADEGAAIEARQELENEWLNVYLKSS